MEKYIIALKEMNIDDSTIIDIIENCTVPELQQAFEQNEIVILSTIPLASCISFFTNKAQVQYGLNKARIILEENEKYDIKTVIYKQEGYPKQLIDIQNPPVVLYYKGQNLNQICQKSVACVGTRNPTVFSLNAINYLVPQWVHEDVSIISGLALGVDTLSHIACLASSGKTVAVLAHGLDCIQPKKNERLARQILEANGTLVSEYPVGVQAKNFRFINRNRIIVGLAQGTIIFECKLKGGTMHSVDFTQQQGKLIFCPNPGKDFKEEQNGINYLINERKAIMIPNGVSGDLVLKKIGYESYSRKITTQFILQKYIDSLLWNLLLRYSFEELLVELRKQYTFVTDISNETLEDLVALLQCIREQNNLERRNMIDYLITLL